MRLACIGALLALAAAAQIPLPSPFLGTSGSGGGGGGGSSVPSFNVTVAGNVLTMAPGKNHDLGNGDSANLCVSTACTITPNVSVTDTGTWYAGVNSANQAMLYCNGITPSDFAIAGFNGSTCTASGPPSDGSFTGTQVAMTSGAFASAPTQYQPTSTGLLAPGTCIAISGATTVAFGSSCLAFATLTDAATVTWATGGVPFSNADLTFTVHSGSRTLNVSGLVNGGSYVAWFKQDATGGEGLILGTGCTWKVSGGGSGAVTPSTGAAAVDVLAFTYDGTNCLANFNKNFN